MSMIFLLRKIKHLQWSRVDVRNGEIYKITAHPGYQGGMQGIYIGDSTEKIPDSFFYDDCDEGYMDKSMDGVIIQADIDDPLPEELIDAKVGEIAVFLPSTFKFWFFIIAGSDHTILPALLFLAVG